MNNLNTKKTLSSGYLDLEEPFSCAETRSRQAIASEYRPPRSTHRVPLPTDQHDDWEAALERYKQKVPTEKKLSYKLRRIEERDPRSMEIEAAKRRMFFDMLKCSYSDRGDTYIWALLVLLISAFVLLPVFGVVRGYLFAACVTTFWTVLHKVAGI
jgi:hypothetical protein